MNRDRVLNNIILPALLGGLSLLLRLSLISKGPFNVDCLSLALQAGRSLTTLQLQPLFGTGYPLTVILGALFIRVTQLGGNTDPVFAVNLMSVVLSSLTVAFFFVFVQRFLNRNAAIFSAVLLSVCPVFLGLSTYGKSHTPSLFFLTLGLLALAPYPQSRKTLRIAVAGFFFGCMGAARLQEFMLMALPVSTWILLASRLSGPGQRPAKTTARDFILFWSTAAGTAFLFHAPLLLSAGSTGYFSQLQRYWAISSTPNFLGLFSPALVDSGRVILFSLTPVATALALGGLISLFKKDRAKAAFLILWCVLPLLFLGNLSMTTPRFIMISFLPLIIAAGYFCAAVYSVPNPLFRAGSLFAFSLSAVILLVNIHPVLLFRHRHALLPDFARFIKANTEPSAQIIAGDEALFIRYYGERAILHRPNDPFEITPAALGRFQAGLDETLGRGEPVYITSSGLYSYNPDQAFSRFMERNYLMEYIGERLSEDWHQGATRLRLGVEKLYRIQKR